MPEHSPSPRLNHRSVGQRRSATLAPAVMRIATGIAGFDALTRGGLPRGKLSVVSGAPGCGKSVFALQTLAHAARQGGRTVYVCFEESPREAQDNLRSFGWDLPARLEALARFVDGDLGPEAVSVGRFDICGLLANVEAHCREIGATCVVFDGIDALMSMLADPVSERRELYRLKRWIRDMQLGALVTSKDLSGATLLDTFQPDGMLAFAADCVVHLSATVKDRELIRSLRIVKHRGTLNPGGEFHFVLDGRGITVSCQEPKSSGRIVREAVSPDVGGLDALLDGGYRLLTRIADAQARVRLAERELESRRDELAALSSAGELSLAAGQDVRTLIARARRADPEASRGGRSRRGRSPA